MNTRALWMIALCMMVAPAGACSGCDDDGGRPPSKIPDTGDMGGDQGGVDMAPDPDPVPAYVTLSVDPVQVAYAVGQSAAIKAEVFDTKNARLSPAELVWSATPAGAAMQEPMSGAWTLLEEGEVKVRACTTLAGEDGQPVCGEASLLVNNGGPKITLIRPTPGAMLGGVMAPAAEIVVEGKVEDTFGQVELFINNQPVTLGADGGFTTTLPAIYGVNHIALAATDGIQRTASRVEADVIWAPAYHEAMMDQTRSAIELEDGLILRLGQLFVDDRRAPLTSPEGAVFTEDLVDILLLLLRNVDLQSLIPPLGQGDLQLNIDAVDIGNPSIRMNITDGGLELFVQTQDMTISTSGQIQLLDETLDLTGSITAGVSILATARVEKPGPDSPFEVEIVELSVAIEGATSQFVSPDANAIFALASSALRLQLEDLLKAGLEASFLDAIPAVLSGALNSLDGALSMQEFPLDVGLGSGPITVSFDGKIGSAQLEALRAIFAQVKVVIAALAPPLTMSPGVALMSAPGEVEPEFLDGGRIQMAVRLAVLNGLLHDLWSAGLLNLDVGAILPDGLSSLVEEARIVGKLPPLLVPPMRGEPYDLILYVGQLELEAKFRGQVVRYGIAMSAGLNAQVKDNALTIEIAPVPEIRTWVISVDPEGATPRLSAQALRSLLAGTVWPQLTAALGQGLSLPLPVLDLGSLSSYAPAMASFTLDFEQARDVVVRREFLLIDARLRGTLPPPMATP
jgi:hypothetical protein